MGRPRTRRALSASRFHEGSMNDRTSAAPPAQFLGPDERAALERPASTSIKPQPRPLSDDWAEKQVKRGRLLGQVWDGVRGRLRFRKDGEDERGSRRRSRSRKRDQEEHRGRQREREREEKPREEKPRDESQRDEMPSREEILANYHHLMASGFFSSHAIQSTRQPPPGSAQPSSSTPASSSSSAAAAPPLPTSLIEALSRAPTPRDLASRAPTPRAPTPSAQATPSSPTKSRHAHKQRQSQDDPQAATYDELVASGFFSPPAPSRIPPPTPKGAAPAPTVPTGRNSRDYLHPPQPTWGSSRSATPSTSRAPSPIRSPASASSRGTKRAAADSASDDENEDPNRDPPTPKKKLRKSASRDIAIPKLRNVASRRAMLSRRSVSGPNGSGKEYNNLARRVLGRLPGGNARGSLEVPDRRAEAAARRSTDEPRQPLQEVQHSRVLRPRRSAAEALSVVPNANRGIPKVPIIPEKFAIYDEDAENVAPAVAIRF
ncbi:hypothetical protein ACJ41O_013921 [Fusarium nematophilum]